MHRKPRVEGNLWREMFDLGQRGPLGKGWAHLRLRLTLTASDVCVHAEKISRFRPLFCQNCRWSCASQGFLLSTLNESLGEASSLQYYIALEHLQPNFRHRLTPLLSLSCTQMTLQRPHSIHLWQPSISSQCLFFMFHLLDLILCASTYQTSPPHQYAAMITKFQV